MSKKCQVNVKSTSKNRLQQITTSYNKLQQQNSENPCIYATNYDKIQQIIKGYKRTADFF